jgi:glycosyltransferase involved in cell wall biosynthesis
MEAFETVEMSTDLLIIGGGMSACGAAFEASYWAKKNNLKVTLVDKAAMDRSGAVAMGLSAINQYVGLKDGQNTVKDYVDYVRNDLMGITREDLVRLYNEAQVLVSPSLYEGFGLPAAEAMACGTPVLATTAGAFPEVIEDGVSGLLVPPGDARALADAIDGLMGDAGLRGRLGDEGRRRILDHFSWRKTGERTLALYRQVRSDAVRR